MKTVHFITLFLTSNQIGQSVGGLPCPTPKEDILDSLKVKCIVGMIDHRYKRVLLSYPHARK